MSIQSLSNSLALVERPTFAQTATGSASVSAWTTVEAALPCRFQPTKGDETIQEDKLTVIITHKLFCLTTANIQQQDRVTVGSIVARVHAIRNIDMLSHHLEVDLSSKV